MTWDDSNAFAHKIGGRLPSIEEVQVFKSLVSTENYDLWIPVHDPDNKAWMNMGNVDPLDGIY